MLYIVFVQLKQVIYFMFEIYGLLVNDISLNKYVKDVLYNYYDINNQIESIFFLVVSLKYFFSYCLFCFYKCFFYLE